MDDNPYQSPATGNQPAATTASAAPLWARVAAILLFLLATGASSLAAVFGTRFGLRSLSSEDQWMIDLFTGCFAAAAVVFTLVGLLVLFVSLQPLTSDRWNSGRDENSRDQEDGVIQIAVIALAIGLIVIGVKGFTAEGIPLTKAKSLHGKAGQLAGVACILGGVLFIPAFFLALTLFR
jgi:hypothetical protein